MSNIIVLFWVLVQSVLIVAAQTFLKIAVNMFGAFELSWRYFRTVLTTWQLYVSGLLALSTVLLWAYLLKHNDLSFVYPLLSISYIISLFVGSFIFGETIPLTRWIGVVIVMIGVYFIIK